MPTSTFALDRGGPKRLEVSWTGIWNDVTVKLDGALLGTIPGKTALEQGQRFPLPDGTTLLVQLDKSFGSNELQVMRDGKPLPGSAADPAEKLRLATMLTYFVAGCSLVTGSAAVGLHIEPLLRRGIGWPSLFEAPVFGALGYLTQRRYKGALISTTTILLLTGFWLLSMRPDTRGPPPVGIFLRILFIVPMLRAIPAIDELNEADQTDQRKRSG